MQSHSLSILGQNPHQLRKVRLPDSKHPAPRLQKGGSCQGCRATAGMLLKDAAQLEKSRASILNRQGAGGRASGVPVWGYQQIKENNTGSAGVNKQAGALAPTVMSGWHTVLLSWLRHTLVRINLRVQTSLRPWQPLACSSLVLLTAPSFNPRAGAALAPRPPVHEKASGAAAGHGAHTLTQLRCAFSGAAVRLRCQTGCGQKS